MDATERTRLRALCEAATDRPWTHSDLDIISYNEGPGRGFVASAHTDPGSHEDDPDIARADVALIVESVNALPALLDALDAAEKERDALRAQLDTALGSVRQLRADVELATTQRDEERCRADDAEAVVETMRAEHVLLRSIVDGRTTPPTDAEIAAHAGSWMIVGRSLTLIASAGRAADCACNARSLGAGWRWIALDADGRPCAWPTVTL